MHAQTADGQAEQAPRTRNGFVEEGQFLALELAMPDETPPLPEDASALRLLAVSPCGRWVHGVTAGSEPHLLTALFKGAAGGVVNLGTLDAEPTLALHAPRRGEGAGPSIVLGFNDASGFELQRCAALRIPDVLQEPGFRVPPLKRVARIESARLCAAAPPPSGDGFIGCLAEDRVLALDGRTPEASAQAPTPGPPPEGVALHREGDRLVWLAAHDRVARWSMAQHFVETVGLTPALPPEPVIHSALRADGRLLLVMRGGGVYLAAPETGALERAAALPLAPVQSAAALRDGRVYAMCGEELAHFARADVETGASEPLGAVAAALPAKRYGFVFGPSGVTRDGTLFFGERDRRSHLWAYYPPADGGAANAAQPR